MANTGQPLFFARAGLAFWDFADAVESELIPPAATLPLIAEILGIFSACEKSSIH
jgi:hypothetical protein